MNRIHCYNDVTKHLGINQSTVCLDYQTTSFGGQTKIVVNITESTVSQNWTWNYIYSDDNKSQQLTCWVIMI